MLSNPVLKYGERIESQAKFRAVRQRAGRQNSQKEQVAYLECVDVAKPVLHMAVNDQLRQPQNLPAQMERITKATLLSFLGGERFDRLQVEVVVEMQVVEVLAMDE